MIFRNSDFIRKLMLSMLTAVLLSSASASAARVLFFPAEHGNPDIRKRLELACRFYGIDLLNGATAEDADTPTATVIEAAALANLYRADIPTDESRGLLIAGINSRISPDVLSRWTGEVIVPVSSVIQNKADASVLVSEERQDFSAELAGQRLAVDIAEGFQLPADIGTPLLSYENRNALFSVSGNICLLADLAVDDPPDTFIWFYDRGFFAEIAPYMMFLRNAFGEYGWHAAGDFANLTIDDPWLRESYGNLRFDELLEEMDRADFHTTIAYIPWNYDRPSSTNVIQLFRNNPDRFSLCVHGNNHDHREFYSYEPKPDAAWPARPFPEQEADIRQGLARIEAFEDFSGLPVDRVMVFPHDIAPDRTLELLKKYNFKATSNVGKVPLDSPVPEDPLFWLRRVTDRYGGGLAALDRTEPANRTTADIAVDLFLDNPVLFVEHLRFFSDSRAAFNSFARQVNRLQSDIEWVGLGTLTDHLYLLRKEEDGIWGVRSFSPDIILNNPDDEPRRYRILKKDDGGIPIRQVSVDDRYVDFFRCSDNRIEIEITIPPQEERRVRIVYENDFVAADEDLAKRDLQVNMLRFLSGVRDQYLTAGPLGAAVDRFYYDTNLYHFGMKALFLIAAVLLLIPTVLFFVIRKKMRRHDA